VDALLLEQVAQPCAEQVVVVDDQDAKRLDRALIACRKRLGQITPPLRGQV